MTDFDKKVQENGEYRKGFTDGRMDRLNGLVNALLPFQKMLGTEHEKWSEKYSQGYRAGWRSAAKGGDE